MLLKQVIQGIALPLTILINKSLCEGNFPKALKLAKIIPVYKKDDHEQLGNYRLISLLSNLSKIYKRVIYNRLNKFFERHDLFDKQQFGLRPKRTTMDADTVLMKDVLNSLNKKEYTTAVFCDLSKAFDTISHEVLQYKYN